MTVNFWMKIMSFFDKIINFGSAYIKHVNIIQESLKMSDIQKQRDYLANYLQLLSDMSKVGFIISLNNLLATENRPEIVMILQWINVNVEALAAGKYRKKATEDYPTRGLTLQDVEHLFQVWDALPPDQCRDEVTSMMNHLSVQGRQEFAAHLDQLAWLTQVHLQSAVQVGSSAPFHGASRTIEDFAAQAESNLRYGHRPATGITPHQAALQQRLQGFLNLAAMARTWR